MKIAAKVFIILSMIGLCFLIVPIIVGAIALHKLEKATSKNDLIVIGVLTILFCSVIGGILMLCMSEDELLSNRHVVAIEKKNAESTSDLITKIDHLKKLKDDGVISEEEYQKAKTKIISNE